MKNVTRKLTPIKKVLETSRCRREQRRQQICPSSVTCWKGHQNPVNVSVIEMDTRGGRVVLPWVAVAGEWIHISIQDKMGYFRTTSARVVWSQRLPNTSRVIVGLCFLEEVIAAA